MSSRNNFMLTLVRNLGKHGEIFLNETILKNKEFREGFTCVRIILENSSKYFVHGWASRP